jgi:hypothetical protein
MSTFKEWQEANLTPEQLTECNAACLVEEERRIKAGANQAGHIEFATPEARQEFENGTNPTFKKYWNQYSATL